MQSEGEDSAKLTSYASYIESAHAVPLQYGVRAPRIPAPDRYALAWETPEELAAPETPRTLRRVCPLGQDLQLSCYKYFGSTSPELAIDWTKRESKNLRLSATGVQAAVQERGVDDMRTFLAAIYDSVIVTAMEMARLIYGGPYQGSYRYSRGSTVNLIRGARWDVLPYSKTEPGLESEDTEHEKPEGPKMVVICIPPWELSKLDFQEFTTRRTFAVGELNLTPGDVRISKAHILWTVVYEACKRAHRCSYFIVTTYDHWVFGNMSQDSTTASVSSVFDFSERSGVYHRPSLLQLVTYWELLSIGEAHQDAPSDEE